MHELKGPPHLQRNCFFIINIITIIIIIVHFFHAHWPSPFHNRILLQTNILTKTPQLIVPAFSPPWANEISYQVPWMRCVKSEVENMWISELGFSSLIFHLCIFTDGQSTILYCQLTMLQLLSAEGVFYWRADHTISYITAWLCVC